MKRGWYVALGLGAAAVIGLALYATFFPGTAEPVAEGQSEDREYARTEDEARVKAYLLDRYALYKRLQVVKWGPHDATMSLGLKWPRRGAASGTAKQDASAESRPAKVLRVVYVWQNSMDNRRKEDELFFLQDGKVLGVEANPFGDRWKEHYAHEKR